MSDYLPPNLWSMILVKLPIRSVIQCTTVCKQWRSIITSPAFISDHLRLSRQNNPLLLTPPTTIAPKTMSLRFDSTDESPPRLSQTLHCPFPIFLNCPFRVVGSVDGLVLLSDDFLSSTTVPMLMILWNPSIRKSVTLPVPRFTSHWAGPYLGFGIDSGTGDYKVVRFVYQDVCWPPCPAEVYSLRDRSWRTVKSDNVDLVPVGNWTQCFIHNAVHWIGGRKEPPGSNHSHQEILLFDLGTEEFKKMALPRVDHDGLISIFVAGGLLAVSARAVIRNYHCSTDMDIWVKTDYYTDLWTKIATLDAWKLDVGKWLNVRRLCWEIPMGSGGARDSREIQVPASCSLLLEKSAVDRYVLSYTESLVLLDEQDRAVQAAVCETLEETQVGANIS